MKVLFSRLSAYKLESLTEFLESEFSATTKNKFLDKLNSRIEVISKNPEIFPASKIDEKLRKCVVTKRSILLYEIHDDHIHILNLIDTRQDVKKIHEELKKHFG